jgi:hypothetical protein
MAQTVVGVFETHEGAIQGIHELREAGFTPRQISIFVPDVREVEHYGDEVGVRVVQAGGAGIILGGLAGWLLGLTALAIPGIGPVLAAGPVAGAVVGLIGGASLGGFVGMLAGIGMPHHNAEEYAREMQSGRTLVVVHPDGGFAAAEAALNRARPIGLHHYQEKIGCEAPPVLDPISGLPPVPED